MKIRKMTAHFGALEGKTLELSDGLNVLYAPNESGKSTWCAFLRAMLYGVSTSQRAKAGQQPDKVKYRPWSGTPMSGSMELLTERGPVTLRRWTERANQPMQAFSATITGTETPVPGLTAENAGEAITGMPQAVFDRSVFIRQAGLELSGDPELEKRIGAIVSTGDEEVSYTETEARLRAWQRHRRGGKRGAIPELEAEMDEARRTLEDMRADTDAIAAMDDELEALEARRDEALARVQSERAGERKKALAELGRARERVQAAETAHGEAASALEAAEAALDATPYGRMGTEEAARRSEKDIYAAQELSRLAEKLPPVKLAYIPLGAAALAFLLALLLPWKVECAAAGCVFVLLFVVMFLRLQGIRRTKQETLDDRQRILDAYGVGGEEQIGALLERYRGLWSERERARFRLEEAEAALTAARAAQKEAETETISRLDFVSGENAAVRAGREAEELTGLIAALREKRAMAEGRLRARGDAMVLESVLSDGARRRAALEEQESAIGLALEALAQADAELQQRFSPRLAKTAAALFSRLTDGRYDEITLARDLTAKARRTGDAAGWEPDYLSAGAKDQLYLALRLTVCELALPGDDPCPIVLDDAFTTFDRARMERALALLKELSASRQILLFTCHEREGEYFAGDRSVAVLTLEG